MHVGSVSVSFSLYTNCILYIFSLFPYLLQFSLFLSLRLHLSFLISGILVVLVLSLLSLIFSDLLFEQIILVPSMSKSEVGVEFDILKRTQMQEFQGDHRRVITTTTTTTAAARESSQEIEEDDKLHSKRLGLGEFNATMSDQEDEEEDQGFRTPTSYDHKIPKIKQCPPAPKKPMPPPPSKKRKSSSVLSSSPSTNARRKCLRSDLSPQDIDSLFPRAILDDLHRKIKKARTVLVKEEEEEDDDNENQ